MLKGQIPGDFFQNPLITPVLRGVNGAYSPKNANMLVFVKLLSSIKNKRALLLT